ncbi:SNARE associated Golgi protein [Peptoclostridium litorale DSM 5388]|uniref:TVP38/TMEM64 family membrane protein n=1 Tax=Peptoclostridium litorale DSM 5388 TaxID=1121324 RepID=A0A069RDJ1_PEPLI|nr:TVP38/TMEM64 family protein [Peptoclostridium litorale]KDR95109.1 putative membrane protein [Peptoclostridium litorale DSM 5388]SIN74869.1 SNARE associated Golgi protein [Peptoclostridium litorale DSM 5388]
MIFQSVAAPLPAFLVTFANAAIFGWFWGALLSWSSAMAGAVICFFIAKVYGREVVEKFTGMYALENVDEFFDRYGSYAVLIARLLPFMSFDIVSYAAGLMSMSFWTFVWATGLGQMPATIIYSYIGGMLTGSAKIVGRAIAQEEKHIIVK